MKFTVTSLIAGLVLIGSGDRIAAEPVVEPIVLARKGFVSPVGTVLTKDSTMVMEAAAMSIKAGPQEIEGTSSRKSTGKETIEILSPDKIRRTIVTRESGGGMTVNGKDRPIPEKGEPLLGLPVILDRKDGKWSASLESGDAPSKEQQERLEKQVREVDRDSDYQMYGDSPRKPGDKWTVTPDKLMNFGGAEDVTGEYSVEFVEIGEFEGTRCATLKATFDIKGKSEESDDSPQMSLHFKGVAISHRSIADMVDIGVEVSGTMTVDGTPAENVTLHVEGPTTMTEKISIKRP